MSPFPSCREGNTTCLLSSRMGKAVIIAAKFPAYMALPLLRNHQAALGGGRVRVAPGDLITSLSTDKTSYSAAFCFFNMLTAQRDGVTVAQSTAVKTFFWGGGDMIGWHTVQPPC